MASWDKLKFICIILSIGRCIINRCSIKGCSQYTYGASLFCYYHTKVASGLIKQDLSYLKSKYEIECATGQREPNWEVALKELPRIRRLCNNVVKWAKIPIQELIHEALVCVAVSDIKKKKYAYYLNLSIKGVLRNFIAKFKDVVSYYWIPFKESVESIPLNDNMVNEFEDSPEYELILKEKNDFIKYKIYSFRKTLSKIDRIIFDHRLWFVNKTTLRDLAIKLNSSKSNIQRIEQNLKDKFKEYLNDK